MPPVPTNLTAVLVAVKAQLMTKLGFPAERVLTMADDRFRGHFQADQVVLLRAKSQRWETTHNGGGRTDSRVRRRTAVTLQTRLFTDEVSQDLLLLEDASLGHYAAEHTILDALEMFQPLNGNGDWLVYEPIHLEEAGQVDKPPEQSGWAQASYSFDLCFTLDLDQTYQ